jgi:hypothetical protein
MKLALSSGAKPSFVIGNLPGFSKDPLGFMTRCARECGDMVGLAAGDLDGRATYIEAG